MKEFLTLLILTFCFSSFSQADTPRVDTAVFTVLPYNPEQQWIFKNGKPAALTVDDYERIEQLVTECIDQYKPENKRFKIDLEHYKRQYIVAENPMGEKEVWINCFCGEGDDDWRTQLVIVMDGGSCYFNLKINLTTGKYYDFMVNGDA